MRRGRGRRRGRKRRRRRRRRTGRRYSLLHFPCSAHLVLDLS